MCTPGIPGRRTAPRRPGVPLPSGAVLRPLHRDLASSRFRANGQPALAVYSPRRPRTGLWRCGTGCSSLTLDGEQVTDNSYSKALTSRRGP